MKKKPAGAGSIPERHCHGRHSAVSGSDSLTEGMRGSGMAVELPPSPAGHPGLQRDVGCGSCLQQPCALEFQERSFSSELTHTHTHEAGAGVPLAASNHSCPAKGVPRAQAEK